MAIKYYRLKKDSPSLKEGAILSNQFPGGDYNPIDDLWDSVTFTEVGTCFAREGIENNPDWYERVYKDAKGIYHTADQMRELYKSTLTA